jgi:hypothetical protein
VPATSSSLSAVRRAVTDAVTDAELASPHLSTVESITLVQALGSVPDPRKRRVAVTVCSRCCCWRWERCWQEPAPTPRSPTGPRWGLSRSCDQHALLMRSPGYSALESASQSRSTGTPARCFPRPHSYTTVNSTPPASRDRRRRASRPIAARAATGRRARPRRPESKRRSSRSRMTTVMAGVYPHDELSSYACPAYLLECS